LKIRHLFEQIDQDILRYANLAKKECRNYLSNVSTYDNILIRGMSKSNPTAGVKQVRKDRKPRDTDSEIADAVERYREVHFPKVPARQESVFCFTNNNSNRQEIHNYGTLYYVFIPDGAVYWESKNVDDFTGSGIYSHLLRIQKDYSRDPKAPENFYTYMIDNDSIVKKLDEYFSQAWTNLEDIFRNDSRKGGNEIVIDCNFYFYFNVNVIEDVKSFLKINFEN